MTHMIQQVRMVPFRCKACKSTERPHLAKGLCTRCYQTGMKRKSRANKSVKKDV